GRTDAPGGAAVPFGVRWRGPAGTARAATAAVGQHQVEVEVNSDASGGRRACPRGAGGSVPGAGPVGGWGGGGAGVAPRRVGRPSGDRRTCGGGQAEPPRGRASASLAPPAEPAVRRSCPANRGEPPPTGRSCGGRRRAGRRRRGRKPSLTCGYM